MQARNNSFLFTLEQESRQPGTGHRISTVLDPLRRLWWIHLPIIGLMTAVSLIISYLRLPPVYGSFQLQHLLYLSRCLMSFLE